MSTNQIMLYFLSALAGVVLLIAPSIAAMWDIAGFDRGRNPRTAVLVMDWLVQFLVFCGIVLLCWITYDEAKNYKEPTKNNLVFLSLPHVLTNSNALEPNKEFVENFNDVIKVHEKVFIVITDDWALGKDIEFVNKFVKEDFGINAEVIGVLPRFKHRRTKARRIHSWLLLNNRKWDSISVVDSEHMSEFSHFQILAYQGFADYKADLLKIRIASTKQSFPELRELVPTEVKLTNKPYFGGRRLLNGQDSADQTSRKELEAANARSIHRSSQTNIQYRGQTP